MHHGRPRRRESWEARRFRDASPSLQLITYALGRVEEQAAGLSKTESRLWDIAGMKSRAEEEGEACAFGANTDGPWRGSARSSRYPIWQRAAGFGEAASDSEALVKPQATVKL